MEIVIPASTYTNGDSKSQKSKSGNLFYLSGNVLIESSGESNKRISYLTGSSEALTLPIKCFSFAYSPFDSETEDLIIGEGIGKSPSVYRCSKDGKIVKWRNNCHRFGVSSIFSSPKIQLFISCWLQI